MKHLAVRKLGRGAWKRNVEFVDRMWVDIRRRVEAWDLAWPKVRLYQDGLPVCGREREIVRDLAAAGSANHQVLLSLMERGATLMGTESPELLLAEYRLMQKILSAGDDGDLARLQARHEAEGRRLLARRDRFIAGRIDRTLGSGETGVLFLGLLHSVGPHLAPNIRVLRPIRSLARARREAARPPLHPHTYGTSRPRG